MPTLQIFGDSNSNTGVGGLPPTVIYPNRLGMTVTNHAANSNMAMDQSWKIQTVSNGSFDYNIIMVGTNDAQAYGTNTTKRAAYIDFMRTMAVYACVGTIKTGRSGTATKTGSWFNTPGNFSGDDVLGMFTIQNGATWSDTFSGDSLYFGYVLQNHVDSLSVFDVEVDSTVIDSVTLNGTTIGNSTVGRNFSVATRQYDGLGSGSHTVRLINNSTKCFFPEFIAGSTQATKKPVYIINVQKCASGSYTGTNSDSNVGDFCTAIQSMVDDLYNSGLPVYVVDINSLIDTSTDLLVDGIHDNLLGSNKIVCQLLTQMNGWNFSL